MKIETVRVGFLESNTGRKSSSRLTVVICAAICLFAAGVEGAGKIISIAKGNEAAAADWTGIAILVGALLLGNGALKAAQRINSKPDTFNTGDVNANLENTNQ